MLKVLANINRDYLINSKKVTSYFVNTIVKSYSTTSTTVTENINSNINQENQVNNEQPQQGPQIPSRPLNWDNFKFTNVVESREDFDYVKKILPHQMVPDPPKHESYPTPSGWLPPNYEKSSKLPYFVLRTRYHNFPLYVLEREGGSRKLVKIRNIEGNIWEFDKDLRNYIEKCLQRYENKKLTIYSQVNEVQRNVVVKGHYQEYINKFLIDCGF